MKKEIYIFGHKNPDTDSVCAAIGMAYLKNSLDKENSYIPMTAGEVNSETAYVLERFGAKPPQVVSDIRRQIKDISVRQVEGVDENLTVREAWAIMNEAEDYTVPVLGANGNVIGILTIGDIARTYMDVKDKTGVANAKTPVKNILKVTKGNLVCGKEDKIIDKGSLHVAAAGVKLSSENIQAGDIAIISDNEENQKSLIEKSVGMLILCGGAKVSDDVVKLATEKGIILISSDITLYEAARFITQSVPVKAIMKPIDDTCKFDMCDFVDDIKNEVADKRYRDYPVEEEGKFAGMISKSSLLDSSSKKIIMVDHNETDQAVFGLFQAEIVEIVDHHKLGTVETVQPISVTNMPWGSTCSIIASMFKENNIDIPSDIAGLLCSAILSDTMLFKSPTCTEIDAEIAKDLAKKAGVELQDLWDGMLRASLDLDSKTEKEIFYQDYKQFKADGFTFGAGQVLAANSEDVQVVKNRMLPYMSEALKEEAIDMVCLMITNVAEDSTELIYAGDNAASVIESAFGQKERDNGVYLEGVMSRKKQLIPPIMAVLQK